MRFFYIKNLPTVVINFDNFYEDELKVNALKARRKIAGLLKAIRNFFFFPREVVQPRYNLKLQVSRLKLMVF